MSLAICSIAKGICVNTVGLLRQRALYILSTGYVAKLLEGRQGGGE